MNIGMVGLGRRGGSMAERPRRQGHAVVRYDRRSGFVDAGVSGGVWGLENGCCIMAGGAEEDIDHPWPGLHALVAERGSAHVGRTGSGHGTTMLHNGVEHGMTKSLAERYELLAARFTSRQEDPQATRAIAAMSRTRFGGHPA